MEIIGIYKILSPSGKVYIGQSLNIYDRWKVYKNLNCKTQPRIYNSLIEYGVENHIFEIIEECTEEDLNKIERKWQDYYNVIGEFGMNCLLTKANDKSGKLSNETKLKISKAHKGKVLSEEHKLKLSISTKGIKKNSKESIEKMRIKAIGRKHTDETKLKLSKINTKRKVLDVLTNIIYNSGKEISKLFNIPYSNLQFKLLGYRLNNTQFEYIDLNENGKGRAFEINYIPYSNSKEIINIENNLLFRSVKDASEYYNISKSTLMRKLKNGNFFLKYKNEQN